MLYSFIILDSSSRYILFRRIISEVKLPSRCCTMFINRFIINGLRNSHRKLHHTSISEVFKVKQPGDNVEIKGWVKSMRKMKETTFFDVNDGSDIKRLQVVLSSAEDIDNLSAGASVTVKGNLVEAPSGQLELSATEVKVIGECDIRDGYPFAPRKKYATDYVRQYLHFRPRTRQFTSFLKIRDAVHLEIHNYLHSKGFIQIHTPVLTSNDCEGAGEVFAVAPSNKNMLQTMVKPDLSIDQAYFGCDTYLAVSGQMHLEAAAHSLTNVYSFGPTFRAENSKSRYHLSEFYMLEAEMAFVQDIEILINMIELFIKSITFKILDKCAEEIALCKENEEHIAGVMIRDFNVLDYSEAAAILLKNNNKFKTNFKEAMGPVKEHEIFLVKYCQSPVFVVNWPKIMKPFYMKESQEDSTKVLALDLLAPNVGEVIGGSLRENDYYKLRDKLPKDSQNLDWYLELRKFGGVPTAGFGLGFERYLQSLVGINNIKDTIPFPRWPHNCAM